MTVVMKTWRLGSCLLLLTALAACGDNGDAVPAGQPTEQQSASPQSLVPAADEPASAPAAAEAAVAKTGEQLAQPCLSCHSVDNFAGMDVATLQAAMQSIKAGEITHLQLPDSLSDEDLAKIAAFLAAANATGAS